MRLCFDSFLTLSISQLVFFCLEKFSPKLIAFVNFLAYSSLMASNKSKTIKDSEKLKKIWKKAKKRLRQKKAQEKALKAAASHHWQLGNYWQKRSKSYVCARSSGADGSRKKPWKLRQPSPGTQELFAEKKCGEPADPPPRQVNIQHHVKEINPSLVVCGQKNFLDQEHLETVILLITKICSWL